MPHSPRKRIIIKKPGGHDALQITDDRIGPPAPGEAQVEVKACGVNFADIAVRLGLYRAAKDLYPLTPGLEFSGVVREVGEEVHEFSEGDRVFGVCRFGGYASSINCPSHQLWPMPEAWSYEKGATFAVVYLTAYYGIHHVGHLSEPDKVLLHSAAGGVGTAALHLLRINGNFCAAVVGRSHKREAAAKAGADLVIDKETQDLWAEAEKASPEGWDLILDANGASTLKGSYEHLRPQGRLIIYGFASMFSPSGKKNIPKLLWYYLKTPRFSPFDLTTSNKTVAGFNLIYLFDKVEPFRKIMEILLRWDAKGLLPSMPVKSYAFEEAAKAHRDLESGQTIGKLVLTI